METMNLQADRHDSRGPGGVELGREFNADTHGRG
jgi:hypothetical protein